MQYLYWTHPQIYNYVYLSNFYLNFEIQVNLVLPALRESLGSLVLPQGVVSLLWELCHVSSPMLAVELEASAPSMLALSVITPRMLGSGASRKEGGFLPGKVAWRALTCSTWYLLTLANSVPIRAGGASLMSSSLWASGYKFLFRWLQTFSRLRHGILVLALLISSTADVVATTTSSSDRSLSKKLLASRIEVREAMTSRTNVCILTSFVLIFEAVGITCFTKLSRQGVLVAATLGCRYLAFSILCFSLGTLSVHFNSKRELVCS